MGRKHSRAGQYIYLCFAGLVFFSSWGCATLAEIEKRQAADTHYLRGQELFMRGDYEGALRENREVLSLTDRKPPADRALFSLGLIYAHHTNPGRDYKMSRDFFTQLIGEHPQSALVEQAKMWVNVLDEIERERQAAQKEKPVTSEPAQKKKAPENNELAVCKHLLQGQELLVKGDYQQSLKENQQALFLQDKKTPGGDKALFAMGLIYVHYDNPDRDYKKSMECFAKLVEDYPQSALVEQAKIWMNILDIIEKEKQIDIEIEKKKKDLER